MGTDVERIGEGMIWCQELWASPLDIGIALWLLSQQLSLACIAPVILISVFVAWTSRLTTATRLAQKAWIEKVQERLRITSSMLNDMKAVKMLGLTQVLFSVIQGARRTEIQTSRAFRKLKVLNILLCETHNSLSLVFTNTTSSEFANFHGSNFGLLLLRYYCGLLEE